MIKEKKMLIATVGTIFILLITGFNIHDFAKSKLITIPVQKTVLKTVSLASASQFAVLAGTSIHNLGATSIKGEIGLSPGQWVSGFPQDKLSYAKKEESELAKQDLTKAYNDAKGRRSKDMVSINGDIGNLTLTPGLYHSITSLQIASGNLTFDAMGKRNAIFIIQIASTLITRPEIKILLKGGAMASNIFWQVGDSAILGSYTDFKGTILAQKSITFYNGSTLQGRGFARAGAVNLASNKINQH